MNIPLPANFFLAEASASTSLDLIQVFKASPVIYALLILMSLLAFVIWIYSLLTLRLSHLMPTTFVSSLKELLEDNLYEKALHLCQSNQHITSKIIACGIAARQHGSQVILDSIQAEGRRCGNALWQRLSFLNDIAVVAPMLGLLGTVLGLFYAFYDMNRTTESISSIFDGLGIAIGTTVAGLVVAILAMIFHATLKYKIVKLLNNLENEMITLGGLIQPSSRSSGA